MFRIRCEINFFFCCCFAGNGPSGITLSYMLAGNWPYWNKNEIEKHPDELLRARLSCADADKSLVEQDLVQLAEGLEGRSTNPVSLLVSNNYKYSIFRHIYKVINAFDEKIKTKFLNISFAYQTLKNRLIIFYFYVFTLLVARQLTKSMR